MNEKIKVEKHIAEALDKLLEDGKTKYGVISVVSDTAPYHRYLERYVKVLKNEFWIEGSMDDLIEILVKGYYTDKKVFYHKRK